MNANALNLDLHALGAPKSLDDLIALAKEVRSEFQSLHATMEQVLAKGREPQGAVS